MIKKGKQINTPRLIFQKIVLHRDKYRGNCPDKWISHVHRAALRIAGILHKLQFDKLQSSNDEEVCYNQRWRGEKNIKNDEAKLRMCNSEANRYWKARTSHCPISGVQHARENIAHLRTRAL